MTSITEDALVMQREKLRHQLQEQRKLIAQQLSPIQGSSNNFPRSVTMRFLTQRPALIGKLAAEIMAILLGVRLYKFLSALLILIRIIKYGSMNAQKRLNSSER